MALYRGNAWAYAEGPPEINDNLIMDKAYFASTRPLAIEQLIIDAIEANDDLEEPYDLAVVEISMETVPTVPNWRP